jgi:hypothetical protein
MERHPHSGRNVPPPPSRRSGPAAFSFERPQPGYPERSPLAPPPLPQYPSGHVEARARIPEAFSYEEALKPRELFDPHRNAAHAEWLRGQLKEVRGSSVTVAALTVTMGLLMAFMGSQGVISRSFDSMERGGAGLMWAVGQAACVFAGIELRKALQKRKMGLSSEEE